jgi:hypothetical protein
MIDSQVWQTPVPFTHDWMIVTTAAPARTATGAASQIISRMSGAFSNRSGCVKDNQSQAQPGFWAAQRYILERSRNGHCEKPKRLIAASWVPASAGMTGESRCPAVQFRFHSGRAGPADRR